MNHEKQENKWTLVLLGGGARGHGVRFYGIMCYYIRRLFRIMEVQILVITGVFENDRFIPDSPIPIPQKKGEGNNR